MSTITNKGSFNKVNKVDNYWEKTYNNTNNQGISSNDDIVYSNNSVNNNYLSNSSDTLSLNTSGKLMYYTYIIEVNETIEKLKGDEEHYIEYLKLKSNLISPEKKIEILLNLGALNNNLDWGNFKEVIKNKDLTKYDYLSRELVSEDQLKELGWNNITDNMVKDLNFTLNCFEINTPDRICHFLSQCSHESALGNYTIEIASGANYEGRLDLGNINAGDGPKYKGAGYIQLTGRTNYEKFTNSVGDKDIIGIGSQYVAKNYPWVSAGYWWKSNGMNELVDSGANIETISKRVCGGLTGIDSRIYYYNKVYNIFKNNQKDVTITKPTINSQNNDALLKIISKKFEGIENMDEKLVYNILIKYYLKDKSEDVGEWFINNVGVYNQNGFIKTPFSTYNAREDCTGYACIYMSAVSNESVPISHSLEMVNVDGKWAKQVNSMGWKGYRSNNIESLKTGDVLVADDRVYTYSKGQHSEIYLNEIDTFGWGEAQKKYPKENPIIKTQVDGHDVFSEISGKHNYVTVYRFEPNYNELLSLVANDINNQE